MLNRMAQRRRDVQRGEHLRARRLDVAFQPLDAVVLFRILPLDALQRRGRVLLILLRRRGGHLPLDERQRGPARAALRAVAAPRASSCARAPERSICWR